MTSDGAKVPSVSKTLISLFQSDPSNRTCADCRSASVDPSLVYASFCPSYEATRNIVADSEIGIAFHDFALNHRVFAPNAKEQADSQPPDPAKIVNQRFGGHGLFICSNCSEAHRLLGLPITRVLSIQDDASWTQEHARCMRASGGNTRSWKVYEAYMPDTWRQKRPLPSSALEDRLMFCRAKYEALAFAMPPPGPLAELAWHAILARNETGRKYDSAELRDIFRLTPNFSGKVKGKDIETVGILPDRLIDFFCVVSNSMELHPSLQRQDLSELDSMDKLHFWPHIADTYPSKEAHSDMIFPLHLPSFVLPNGCVPSKRQLPPSFYTFVLTQGDGERLYGGALQIHDEHVDLEELKTAILSTGYKGELPVFLQESNDEEDNGDSKGSDIVFFPKCLVLLSHYPYFDLFRQTLLQLYRITLTESPLPVERYVSNLVSEVPLPPRGKVRVEFGFSAHKLLSIERPPFNQLPMSNFSYRPLFATLCVSNIMVVYGCLLQECRVALLSKNCSILTPIAEALLSALFPLDWQGLYIPLMPYSMLDILDAPVPFLVGLDSKYLRETPAKRRPAHVVLVDLDRDVVHLGIDEDTGENRKVPYLPPRDAMKLKTRLEEAGGSIHLLPDNGMKGCVMEGCIKMQLIPNEARPKYAQMTSVTQPGDTHYREGILKATQKAYDKYELNHNMAGFRTIQDEIKPQNSSSKRAASNDEQKKPQWRDRMPKLMKKNSSTQSSLDDEDIPNLLELSDPVGFSSSEIRNAFLRFMVTTFAHYGRYMIEDDDKDLFDETRFLRDLSYDQEATAFVGGILKTQMFQHFLEARLESPDHPEFRFFDESILAKLNRSKVTKFTKGGKLPTPFLDDTSFGGSSPDATTLAQGAFQSRFQVGTATKERHLISKVQARVRGSHVRKLTHQVFETKMTLYREQLVVLWQLSHVPLSLRTKMWPAFSGGYSFARLRLAESEIQRMWKDQNMSSPNRTVSFADETCLEAKELGMDNCVFAHCLQQKVYPKDEEKLNELSRQLRDPYELEEAERLQVHDRLDKIKSHDVTGKIFQDFQIPLKDKMKKVSVARGIWTKPWEATISMSTMMTLFPELKGSLNIAFKSPTAKGKRRFPDAIKVKGILPVDKKLWDEVSLDGVTRKQVTEVTSTYITKVPSIMAKLDKLNDKKLGCSSAIRGSLGWTSKTGIPVAKEVEMLQKFIGRMSQYQSNPQVEVVQLNEASLRDRQQHEMQMLELEAKKRAFEVDVPTLPNDVRIALRALGQPVRLFGENLANVRDRLRMALAHQAILQERGIAVGAFPPPTTQVKQEEEEQVTKYSRASPEIVQARERFFQFSLSQAKERLMKERNYRSQWQRKRARLSDGEDDPQQYVEVTRLDDSCQSTYKALRKVGLEGSQYGDRRPISSIATSGTLVADTPVVATGSWSGTIKLWDGSTPELTQIGEKTMAHEDRIMGMAVLPTHTFGREAVSSVPSTMLATASIDLTAKLWKVSATDDMTTDDDGTSFKFNIEEAAVLKGHAARLCSVAFHPLGDHVATTSFDHTWRLWDVATGSELLLQDGHWKEVYGVGFHPDGSLCSTTDYGGVVQVWDLRTGKSVCHFLGHAKRVVCSEFSPNGFQLATAGDDGTLKVWDLRKRKQFASVPAHSNLITQLRFDKQGEYVVSSSFDATVKAWSTRDWRLLSSGQGHEGKIMGVDLLPNSASFVTCGYDKTLKLWR
eukprot:Nitzschia sp. Nitz4//scaffold38_size140716//63852//70157//NITZ4_003144-RA/size140716-processed-gene-0.32-mRNA-1//1//CDS//3329550069//2593//frame0